MKTSGLNDPLENPIEIQKNNIHLLACGKIHGSPVSRREAIGELEKAVKSAKKSACDILQAAKGRGGDIPVYTRHESCAADCDYTFYCTYINAVNMYILLEHMQELAKKLA